MDWLPEGLATSPVPTANRASVLASRASRASWSGLALPELAWPQSPNTAKLNGSAGRSASGPRNVGDGSEPSRSVLGLVPR